MRAVVPTEDLPTALSQQQARQHVATLLGAPLGGLLYGVTRWLPFAADAVTYALSFVLLGRIRTDLSAPTCTGPRRRARQDIAEGMRYMWSRPFFRVLLVWAPLTNLVINALFFVAILRLIQGGFHPVQIGLVETVAGVSGILGAIAAPAIIERFATGWLTIVAAWSFLPLLVPLAMWNQPLVVAAALGLGLFLNRPATPASGPTGSRSPPTSCRAGSSRRCSSSRCPRCRSPPSSPAPCSAGSAADRPWPCWACSPPSWR